MNWKRPIRHAGTSLSRALKAFGSKDLAGVLSQRSFTRDEARKLECDSVGQIWANYPLEMKLVETVRRLS